jgi:hypothetical protein
MQGKGNLSNMERKSNDNFIFTYMGLKFHKQQTF